MNYNYFSPTNPTRTRVPLHRLEEFPVGTRSMFAINKEDFNKANVDALDLHRLAEKFEEKRIQEKAGKSKQFDDYRVVLMRNGFTFHRSQTWFDICVH